MRNSGTDLFIYLFIYIYRYFFFAFEQRAGSGAFEPSQCISFYCCSLCSPLYLLAPHHFPHVIFSWVHVERVPQFLSEPWAGNMLSLPFNIPRSMNGFQCCIWKARYSVTLCELTNAFLPPQTPLFSVEERTESDSELIYTKFSQVILNHPWVFLEEQYTIGFCLQMDLFIIFESKCPA